MIVRLAVFACFLSLTAHAHKLNLFATATDSKVTGKVYYATSSAVGITIGLHRGDGKVILSAESAADGSFTIANPPDPPYTLVAETADGHRAEFHIDGSGSGSESGSIDAPVHHKKGAVEESRIREIVQEEIHALREHIDRQSSRARYRDVAAGVGYIIGIFGIIALLKRRPGNSKS